MSPWLEINKPPVAKITGNVVVTLPTSTVELDGSRSSDDKGIVSYLWTRDEASPAAGVSVPGCDQGREEVKRGTLPPRFYFNHVAPVTNRGYALESGRPNASLWVILVSPDPRSCGGRCCDGPLAGMWGSSNS